MNKRLGYFLGGAIVVINLAAYYRLAQAIKKVDDLYSVICYNMYREIQKDADKEFGNITSRFNDS